uniref:Uncharacterized protein n=1 Tax=Parascaris equorum TaxID=6256 RepID=A0A914RHR2_PAREQ
MYFGFRLYEKVRRVILLLSMQLCSHQFVVSTF